MNSKKNAICIDYSRRIDKIRSSLRELKIDAALVTSLENIRYLTGFTGSSAVLIIVQESGFFLTDSRYITQSYSEIKGFKIIEYKRQVEKVASILNKLKIRRLGFEDSNVSYDYYKRLGDSLKGFRIIPLSNRLNALRMIKDEKEIQLLKESARICAKGFETAKMRINDGTVERDVAVAVEYKIRRSGAERTSFETIVASGKKAAFPHASPDEKLIKKGEMVIVDCGAVYSGYNSDETCTFFVGKFVKKYKEIYNIVKEAHDAAIDAVKPGVKASSIDTVARDIIKKAGYSRYFCHSTGHGIGLLVHEAPRIAKGAGTILEEGMVFTIEPGIYIPGLGGVRIEDMVLVTKNGCEVLTEVSKEMTVL